MKNEINFNIKFTKKDTSEVFSVVEDSPEERLLVQLQARVLLHQPLDPDFVKYGNDDQDEQGDRQECKTNHHCVVYFRTEGLQRLDPAKSNWRLNVIVVSVIRFGYF